MSALEQEIPVFKKSQESKVSKESKETPPPASVAEKVAVVKKIKPPAAKMLSNLKISKKKQYLIASLIGLLVIYSFIATKVILHMAREANAFDAKVAAMENEIRNLKDAQTKMILKSGDAATIDKLRAELNSYRDRNQQLFDEMQDLRKQNLEYREEIAGNISKASELRQKSFSGYTTQAPVQKRIEDQNSKWTDASPESNR